MSDDDVTTTKHIAAFFDVDHTVLEVNSGSKWVDYQWRSGRLTIRELLLSLKWLQQYRFGYLDYEHMAKRILEGYRGRAVAPIYEEFELFFHRDLAWAICEQARERIEAHHAQGHVVALLTSATHFLSAPLARMLGVQHILCTEVEVIDGVLTGRTIEPVCYGRGKVARAEAFAREHDVDLQQSFFYSDSVSDLPMLDRVGEPRVVNPDPVLRRRARERGWAFEIWKAPANPMPVQRDVGPEPG